MDECESLHGFGIEMSLCMQKDQKIGNSRKFLRIDRSKPLKPPNPSPFWRRLIQKRLALLSRAIFMVGRALGKCPFSNGHNTETCCVRSSLKKCVAFGQCICILQSVYHHIGLQSIVAEAEKDFHLKCALAKCQNTTELFTNCLIYKFSRHE